MEHLIADAKLRNNDKWVMPGDAFTASDGDAADLIAMKFAHKDPKFEQKAVGVLTTAAVEPEGQAGPGQTGRNRSYRRRDLQAETAAGGSETKDGPQ